MQLLADHQFFMISQMQLLNASWIISVSESKSTFLQIEIHDLW